MPVSEKQRIANALNARLSTGPKSERGKGRSRANSLKHGLTGAGVVVPDDLRDEAKLEVANLARDLAPKDWAQYRLVEAAALASVRVRRCQTQNDARATGRRRDAIRDWDRRREDEVADLARRIESDPAEAVRRLRRTTEGCEWLLGQWEDLRDWLDRLGHFAPAQFDRVLRLLGHRARPTVAAEPAAAYWMLNLLAAAPGAVADDLARFFDVPTAEALALAPAADEARATLAELLDREIAELDRLRHRLWEQFDAADRAEAPDRVLEDTTVEGARLVRYQSGAASTLQRAVAAVRKLQKESPEPARRLPRVPRADAVASAAAPRQNEPISSGASATQAKDSPEVKCQEAAPPSAAREGRATLADFILGLLGDPEPPAEVRNDAA